MKNFNEARGLPKDMDLLISDVSAVLRARTNGKDMERRLDHLDKIKERVDKQYRSILETKEVTIP